MCPGPQSLHDNVQLQDPNLPNSERFCLVCFGHSTFTKWQNECQFSLMRKNPIHILIPTQNKPNKQTPTKTMTALSAGGFSAFWKGFKTNPGTQDEDCFQGGQGRRGSILTLKSNTCWQPQSAETEESVKQVQASQRLHWCLPTISWQNPGSRTWLDSQPLLHGLPERQNQYTRKTEREEIIRQVINNWFLEMRNARKCDRSGEREISSVSFNVHPCQ